MSEKIVVKIVVSVFIVVISSWANYNEPTANVGPYHEGESLSIATTKIHRLIQDYRGVPSYRPVVSVVFWYDTEGKNSNIGGFSSSAEYALHRGSSSSFIIPNENTIVTGFSQC